jgi:rhodanese-related sulfurtransferase
VRILTVCKSGKISPPGHGAPREQDCSRAVALEGGMKAWREGDFPLET